MGGEREGMGGVVREQKRVEAMDLSLGRGVGVGELKKEHRAALNKKK